MVHGASMSAGGRNGFRGHVSSIPSTHDKKEGAQSRENLPPYKPRKKKGAVAAAGLSSTDLQAANARKRPASKSNAPKALEPAGKKIKMTPRDPAAPEGKSGAAGASTPFQMLG